MSLERNVKKRLDKKEKREIMLDNSVIQKKNHSFSLKIEENLIKESPVSIDQLSKIEKDVLVIAKEIFKSKKYNTNFSINNKSDIERYPIIGQLFTTCISKLYYSKGYSKKQIFLAIQNLEHEGWIVSERRRTKLEILNDENYKQVIEFIRNNPGIHAFDKKIEKDLGITRSPFIKRVIHLMHFKLIRAHKIGKIVHFFLDDIPSQYDELRALFLNPLNAKLIKEISKDVYITGLQLGNILNEPVHKIHYYLKKLKDLKIIGKWKDKTGKSFYEVNKFLLFSYNKVFKEPNFINLIPFSIEE